MVRARARARAASAGGGGAGGERLLPAATRGVASKGSRVRKAALARREAFAERVLSAAAGAAEATGGSLARPQAAGEPKPKGQSARRRAAKAAKAKKSFSLGDISDALQSHGVNAVAKAPKGGLLAPKAAVSNKVRERVTASESARLAAVAAHGAFTSDPLGTLRAHIEALLPDKGKDKKAGKQNARPPNKNGSAKRKAKKGNNGGGVAAMRG